MKNTKRKHLKLCLLLLFMVLGCFAITNVRTTTVQASSRTFKSNGRTYMEKHNDNTLNTVLYQKVSGSFASVVKISGSNSPIASVNEKYWIDFALEYPQPVIECRLATLIVSPR